MIVIATNNGFYHLNTLLNSICESDLKNEKIIIADTISRDQNHFLYLNIVKKLYPTLDLNIIQTPGRNYDTGAYIHAYKKYEDEIYIFLHDSIKITSSTMLSDTKEYLKTYDIISYIYFPFAGNGDVEWETHLYKNTNEKTYEVGIFGPMFACTRNSLNTIDFSKITLPTTKTEQTTWEGIWPNIFSQKKLKVLYLDIFNYYDLKCRYFRKTLCNRN